MSGISESKYMACSSQPRITAMSTLGWAHYTLYEALPRIAARGFHRVEIASFESYCFHFNFGSPTPGDLRRILDDLGLTPVCLNYSAGMYDAWDPDEADRFVTHWVRKLEQLPEVGIPMMSLGFGERNTRCDQELQLAAAVKAYDRVASIAAGYGIRLLLEVPHLYTIMARPEQVYWVFDRLESDNVGALVDSSHWGIIGYDIDEFLGRLGDRLWHVHLRDSRGPDTADRRQELELTPGHGTVDFRKFGRALVAANYRGDVSIEFEYRDMTFDAIERQYDIGLQRLASCGWQIPEGVNTVATQERKQGLTCEGRD
ncbi:MAG: sugar phosphate isomerase/epimerase [Armatimonadetes bacterium]|nr:sugar phosphate isomerase/epimerase [Armatimonadota bacterium]